jgi:hypothetical protein
VNNNKDVDVKCSQPMKCILSYKSPILFCNPNTQARKGLIMYNTTNGITTLKKHVNVGPSMVKYAKKVVLKNNLKKKSLFSTLTLKKILKTYLNCILKS